MKHYQHNDLGSIISLPFKFFGKKKNIKKGSRLFKGILKKIGFDALDILPFVGNKLTADRKKKKMINNSL